MLKPCNCTILASKPTLVSHMLKWVGGGGNHIMAPEDGLLQPSFMYLTFHLSLSDMKASAFEH